MSGASLADFKLSVAAAAPPDRLAPPLQALWWTAKGDWHKAHGIVMAEEGGDAAWVHAFLHRAEGDHDNAAYWYRRARRPAATVALDAEWDEIATALIGAGGNLNVKS
jgi:hypothetical protein